MGKTYRIHQAGISLIEVLIAVVILSFGMLALASLQAQMFRAGAESKARAAATAFAQGQIEKLRTFRSLVSGAGNYSTIATGSFGGSGNPTYNVAGVTYYGCIQVRRFRFSAAANTFSGPTGTLPSFGVNQSTGAITCSDLGDPNAGSSVSTSIPEFKEITANVGWFDQNGSLKKIQLADTIAAVSPEDSLQLAKSPPESAKGPLFVAKKSAIGAGAGMAPIAVSGNRSEASTNPTPMQFVDSVSSVTSFDVLTFSGTSDPDGVAINRRISVSAVSCVCQDKGEVSSDTNPAFEPTTWNGKLLSYTPAPRKPNGIPVGSYDGSNSDAGVTTICTVCCRDHHDSSKKESGIDKNLRFDPYRTLETDGSHQHYGFKKQGQGYVLDTLLPVGSQTSNEYVEACRVIRVGGRLEVAVDSHQSNMIVTALNASKTGFEQSNFLDRYSGFVKNYSSYAVDNRPSSYPVAPTSLPAPSTAIASSYSDVLEPTPLNYADSSVDRKLLSFGLYIDYLTPETIQAYQCAVAKSNTGACTNLGNRDPLEFIPFYAVNVASLGSWSSTPNENIVKIDGATYSNQGTLATQGGLAKWGIGFNDTAVPGTEQINISNSGLTATVPVDLDDADSSSFVSDAMGFLKKSGISAGSPKYLFVKVGASSTLTLQKLGVTSPAGVTPCNYSSKSATSTCTVGASDALTTLRIANFTSSRGSTITNRYICLPNDSRILTMSTSNEGTTSEYVDVVISSMNTMDHTLYIEVHDGSYASSKACAGILLTPSN